MRLRLPFQADDNSKENKKPVKPKIVSVTDIQRGYQKAPSLARHLPWRDFDEQHKVFLLEDNLSLAVGFEITPLPCEARPAEMMEKIAQSFKEALQNAIPQEKQNPWILQIFVTRESSLTGLMQTIQAAIEPERLTEPLVQAHLETLRTHLDYVSRPEGIFVDTQVTQQVFRGGLWKVYAFLYQRETKAKKPQKAIFAHRRTKSKESKKSSSTLGGDSKNLAETQ